MIIQNKIFAERFESNLHKKLVSQIIFETTWFIDYHLNDKFKFGFGGTINVTTLI